MGFCWLHLVRICWVDLGGGVVTFGRAGLFLGRRLLGFRFTWL